MTDDKKVPMAGLPTEGEDARSVARGVMNASGRERYDRASGDVTYPNEEGPETTSMQQITSNIKETILRYGLQTPPENSDYISLSAVDQGAHDAAASYLETMGLDPTPDAIEQLTWVFLPCLRIMCERSWDPEGGTWRKAGRLGALADTRKKFERFWERLWKHGMTGSDPSAIDSGHDLINYVGFVMRADQERWGDWGEPG